MLSSCLTKRNNRSSKLCSSQWSFKIVFHRSTLHSPHGRIQREGRGGCNPSPPPPSFGKFSNLSDYPFLYQEQLYPLFYAHLTTDNLLTDCRYRGEKNISRFYCYIANDILKAESNLGLVTEWISRRCF